MAVGEVLVGDPGARVDQRQVVVPAQPAEVVAQARFRVGGVPGPVIAGLGHQHQGDADMALAAQVEDLAQGPVGARVDAEVLEVPVVF